MHELLKELSFKFKVGGVTTSKRHILFKSEKNLL